MVPILDCNYCSKFAFSINFTHFDKTSKCFGCSKCFWFTDGMIKLTHAYLNEPFQ